MPFHTQGVNHLHDLWAPDKAISLVLEAVVLSSIAKLGLSSTLSLASHR